MKKLILHAMHTMHADEMMSKMEIILSKAQLEYADIVLLRPQIIARRLHEAGIEEPEVSEIQCGIAKEVLASDSFQNYLASGIKESALDYLRVLIATRLANSCAELKPTIFGISDFSNINRNKVSPMIDSLQFWDLVSTKNSKRELLVSVTEKTDLSIDVISGNLIDVYINLRKIVAKIGRTKLTLSDLLFIKNLETAFRFSASAYNENTLNREIMEELHEKSMKLFIAAKEDRIDKDDLLAFSKTIQEIIKIKEDARKMGLKPVILEKTSEELGRARVFRIKS
jgi:hypothetical protein